MDYRLLGPLEARAGDRALSLGGPKRRAVLAVLLLRAGETVSVDTLIDDVWGERPPVNVIATLHNCISHLRKALGADAIERRAPGYVLHARDEEIDARRFERALVSAQALEPAERAAALREALSSWRGSALADLALEPFAETEAARLEELRLIALEERIDAELEIGRDEQLVAELEALVARHPLRERLRREQMLALYRARRKPDALRAFQEARLALIDELGLEPSNELRELERMMHRDDPALGVAAVIRADSAPREVRRPAVVLCVEPEAGNDIDPETSENELSASIAAVQAAVERHGGSVHQLAGDETLAFFGLPSAHEDDALRALRAAIELRDELTVLKTPARIGLAAGDVIAGGEMPPQAGPAVRRSRRLKELAPPGAIVLGRSILGLVGAAVDTVPVDTTGVAFRLLRLDPDASAVARRLDARLVGREPELAQIEAALARAADRRRPVRLVLSGDPGIGKTRLAREFAARRAEVGVLTGRCVAYGEAVRYFALGQLVSAAADIVDRHEVPSELAPLLASQAPTAPNPDVFRATRLLLEAVAKRGPVVVALEDLHWGSPGLLDLVEYLTAWGGELPVLLLCLARPELLEARPGWREDELTVGPLAPEEALTLVRERQPELPSRRADAVMHAGEGNPLFLEQLAAFEGDELPPTLETLLASRLDRLDPAERALLGDAAVAGREFWRSAVELLTGDDPPVVASRLSALVRRRLVQPATSSFAGEEAFVFHHALIRDAAYASVPKSLRARLHERLGRWLELHSESSDEVVGFHLEQAYRCSEELGVGDEALAREAAERLGASGIRALERMTIPSTIDLLTRATALLPTEDPRRLALVCELGTALKATGDYHRVEEVLAGVADVAARCGNRSAELRARVELVWPRVLRGADTLDDALQFVERSLDEIAAGDDRTLERSWFALAALRGRLQFRHAASEEAALKALDHARVNGFSPAGCLGLLANDACDGPRPVSEGIERCEELLAEADRGSEANIRMSLSHLLAMRTDHAGAEREFNAARALNEEFGASGAAMRDEAIARAEIAWLSGDVTAAESALRDAHAWLEQEVDAAWLATVSARLAELLADAGSRREALALAEKASGLVVRGDLRTEAAWRRARAVAGGADGEMLAREAIALIEPTDELNEQAKAQLALAQVLRAAGRRAEAAEANAAAVLLLRRKGNEALLARIPV
jgi:DNA-binding SARP family transcriptional activator